jgi:hypothetical protein
VARLSNSEHRGSIPGNGQAGPVAFHPTRLGLSSPGK